MKVENSVIPTQEQMEGFMSPGPDGPISMVNLLKFKKRRLTRTVVRLSLRVRKPTLSIQGVL